MAEKHPYASPGVVVAAVNQFRKSFPAKVDAGTLRKLSIAPNNESYVINALRFIGALDPEGNRTDVATATFNRHEDAAFQKALGDMVKTAYGELFNLHGDGAWELPFDNLIAFFRHSDQTSDVVGRKQASTFQALSGLTGHGEPPTPAKPSGKPKEAKPKVAKVVTAATAKPSPLTTPNGGGGGEVRDVGLTVRVEVNLPAAADQETYDRIFRSIRENLLNAK